jgi:hypothetical protein
VVPYRERELTQDSRKKRREVEGEAISGHRAGPFVFDIAPVICAHVEPSRI